MPTVQDEFGRLAREAGVNLVSGSVQGLTGRGHAADIAGSYPDVASALAAIHRELGGRDDLLRGKSERPLVMDFLVDGQQIVEVDEMQHFTTERARSLALYPASVVLGFDRDEYLDLCAQWARKADRYRAAKQAADFPRRGGRRAQRAYLDAVRDLFGVALTRNPVVRAAAPERDAGLAWTRVHHLLRGPTADASDRDGPPPC